MPLSELIEKLCAIQIEYGSDDCQVWVTDEDGEECRVTDVTVTPGDHIVQIDIS